jgi:hypothetical protein
MNSDEAFSEVENFVLRLTSQHFEYGATSDSPVPEMKACFDTLNNSNRNRFMWRLEITMVEKKSRV